MSKEKSNFATPLHLACADDEIRPALECVHFIDGFAYATDGSILVKQSLKEYCNVSVPAPSLSPPALPRRASFWRSSRAIGVLPQTLIRLP